MPIKILFTQKGYFAQVTPPHGANSNWKNEQPMSAGALIKELLKLGCHQTDIGDAFYEADPDWLSKN